MHHFDEAIAAHQQAAAIYSETGDRRGVATALNSIGLTLQQMRLFDEAIAAHQNAIDICRELGNRHCAATALHHLGLVLAEAGNPSEARQCWTEAANALISSGAEKEAAAVRGLLDP
jgi:tetratricopeptide (TPR) repeat protein